MVRSKTTRKRTGKEILKLTRAQIETVEREWYERYNSGVTQWQAEYYK